MVVFCLRFQEDFDGGKWRLLALDLAAGDQKFKAGGGGELGNPKDSVWEDWGTLGKVRGIDSPTRDP